MKKEIEDKRKENQALKEGNKAIMKDRKR